MGIGVLLLPLAVVAVGEWPDVQREAIGPTNPLHGTGRAYLEHEIPLLDSRYKGMAVEVADEAWVAVTLPGSQDVLFHATLSIPGLDPKAPCSRTNETGTHCTTSAVVFFDKDEAVGMGLEDFPTLLPRSFDWECNGFGCA
eukprot:Sspe_Gene.45278::Locus_22378_Transcript_1_1_Confidence_1.000_Length_1332::g.45278::m.45278